MIAFIIMIIAIAVLANSIPDNLPLTVISTIVIFICMVPLNKKYLEKRRDKDE